MAKGLKKTEAKKTDAKKTGAEKTGAEKARDAEAASPRAEAGIHGDAAEAITADPAATLVRPTRSAAKRAPAPKRRAAGMPVPGHEGTATPAASPPTLPEGSAPGEAARTPAEAACERLILYIRQFESQLDQSQEIAMGFAGGEAGVLRIEGLGYSAPDLITFYGKDDAGLRTQLIQHVSQLSVLLRAVPKLAPEDPPLRIGFRLQQSWKGGESGDGSAWQGERL